MKLPADDRAPKIGNMAPLPDIVPRDRVCSVGELLSNAVVPRVSVAVWAFDFEWVKCPECGVSIGIERGSWFACVCGKAEHFTS